jgi:hypothetical protein
MSHLPEKLENEKRTIATMVAWRKAEWPGNGLHQQQRGELFFFRRGWGGSLSTLEIPHHARPARLALQRVAVPLGGVRGCVVGALQEIEQRLFRLR